MFSIDEILLKPLAKRTGFPISTRSAKGNPLTGRFRIAELAIENPETFPLRSFLSLIEAKGSLSPTSLMSGTVRVRELFIHLREITGIRAESGLVNVEQFRAGIEDKTKIDGEALEKHQRSLHIRHLTVKVDRVSTIDFRDGSGERRDYHLGLTQEFEDVDDLFPVGSAIFESCVAAGLSPTIDTIFATFLPGVIWSKINGTNAEPSSR